MAAPPQEASAGKALALLVAGTFFMENLDATVITPALPAMAISFGVVPVDLSIGVSAYMLTLGIFIPISGWMASRFGTRLVFSLAIAVFTLASLLCGMAQSLPTFIAARVLQGIGGAMMVPVGRLVVLRGTPKDRLIQTIAVLTWPALVAPVLGPPLGGLLVQVADWRWIFWLNLPLGALALGAALKIVPKGEAQPLAFDWSGFLLVGSAVFCLMLGAELMANTNAALLPVVLTFMVGGILGAWTIRILRTKERPMLDLSTFKVPSFAAAIFGGSLFRMGVSAVPFLLPAMFQIGFGFDPFHAGLMLMAVFAGNIAMKPMTTAILKRFGFRNVLVVNGILNALMIGACAIITLGMPLWLTVSILFLGGMTRSMQFTALNSIAFSEVAPAQMSDANTLFSMGFQLAMGMGIALGAMAWRLGDWFAGGDDPARPFHIAFALVALVSLASLFDAIRLARHAGQSATNG